MDTMALFRQRFLQATLAAAALSAPFAHSAPPLNIPADPLATSSVSVTPNVMLILDDSGSMDFDYLPDYVNDSESGTTTTAACADAGDDFDGPNGNKNYNPPSQLLGILDGKPDPCQQGDPPFNSPDFNGVYYNPAIWYRPGANADGTDKTSMTSANTTGWTKVKTDVYLSTSTTNLVTGFVDRVWCSDPTSGNTSGACRQNSAYVYPNAFFPFGKNSGSVKTITGAPYYYRMQTAQYCQPPALTNCASGISIDPAIHTSLQKEFCKDAQLTDCAAGNNVTTAHTFSGVRWCKDQTTLANCQKAKINGFIYAKHLGRTKTIDCSTTPTLCAAVQNEGNLNVATVRAEGGTITLTINGKAVMAPVAFPASTSASTVAGLITNAINAFTPTQPDPAYTASQSGNNVNITMVTAGAIGNGFPVVATASQVLTSSIGAITVIGTANSTTQVDLATLTIAGTNLLCRPAKDIPYGGGVVTARASDGHIVTSGGLDAPAERDAFRAAIIDRVNTCAITIATGSYKVTAVDFGPSNSTNPSSVQFVAPATMSPPPNGQAVAMTGTNVGNTFFTKLNMGSTTAPAQPGVNAPSATFVVADMAGGRDQAPANTKIDRRIGVGAFSRTDIVPANNSYTRAVTRTDCAGTSCTYDEEMTNFANWYAYYRKRMMMAKTAVGRAFVPINDTYRVGFITICPIGDVKTLAPVSCSVESASTSGKPVVPEKYLKVDTFDATHKADWYTKVYATAPGGFTPLREALSRVGQIYAGHLGKDLTVNLDPKIDEPMTASCQPNFAILATDGYWNGVGGQKADGTAMDNEDGDNSGKDPWTSLATGTYEGKLGTSTDTLADVAMYYYKTDLRPAGAPFDTDNVRTTAKDKASFQHMVTFTIGLGLDGELNYIRDYETAKSGDFFDIKQGVRSWPVPVKDAPSALDDLWHAAVNGRGLFFSARNPTELANGLQDTLNELLGDDGAGAAAATSNLQPVSGDNFAFIASYHTKDWWGELSARTIDLTTLDVSNHPLWSARDQLDQTTWSNRVIYTFDATDSTGNKLKHFCWPLSGGPTCSDGAGLDSNEQKLFDAKKLSQTGSWTPVTDPRWAAATGRTLVDYIRGDASLEDTGGGQTTDLYRDRTHTLGDLVNAQPAYVRKATFAYSDKGYPEFKACTAGTGTACNAAQFPKPSFPRRGTVYAAGNDGMLHAFETDATNTTNSAYYQTGGISTPALTDDTFSAGNNAGNGVERWAYIPKLLMDNLVLLADSGNVHHYFADGSPRAFDICISTPCAGQDDWRTVLIAGLNSGGYGYYALDITNPLAPKAMWEFGQIDPVTGTAKCWSDADIKLLDKTSDCNLGLSYGLPVATKRNKDGKWVVLVSSGYNNNKNGGDGRGYLYILDAVTGVILNRITTGSGSAAAPSGLGKISAWADDIATDNTGLAVYAGDLDGNLWRFQLDSTAAGYLGVTLVATLMDPSKVAQPITVAPELTLVQGRRVVVLGTGKFIENTDRVAPFQTQTVYALADDLSVTGAGPVIKDVRDASDVVVRTLAPGTAPDERTVTAVTSTTDWSTQHGWLVDLPDPGERVNIDPIVQLGLVSIPSNVPTSDTCTAGGYAWFNFFDIASGGYVPAPGNTMASKKNSDSLLVGQSFVCGPGGNCGIIAIDNKGRPREESPPLAPQGFSGKRVSWRELIGDQ